MESRYLQQARQHYDNGEFEAALTILNDLLRDEPTDTSALFERALVKDAIDDHDGVLEDYTQLMRLDPYNAGAAKNRGIEFSRRGEHEKALADFENALHRHRIWSVQMGTVPDDMTVADYFVDQSRALARLGRKDEAVACAREAFEHDPGNFDACYFLASNAEEFTREYWLAQVESELRKSPEDDRLHFMQSQLLSWAGKIEPGLLALERAIAIAPLDRDYRLEAVARLLDLERWPELEAQCNRVIGMMGNDAAFNSARAYAYAQLKKHGPMLEDIALTVKLALKDSLPLYDCACALGVALKSNPGAEGVRRKCLELLQRAFELGFDDFEWAGKDEDFAQIRNAPEFQELLTRFAPKSNA